MAIFPFAIFKVEGESMLPDFQPGDFIFVNRWAYIFGNPKTGDVVAVKDPRNSKRMMLKRVLRAKKGELFIQGDNEEQSTDSRTFGLVSRDRVVGKVLLCFSVGSTIKSKGVSR